MKAKGIKDEAARNANQAKEAVRENTEQLAAETKATLKNGASEAKSSVMQVAESRKDRVASRVDDYKRAASAAAEKLKENNDPLLGDHIDTLSSKLASASDYLNNTDVKGLTRDVSAFTKKNPELVLGGALLLGFAATRFLKASSEQVPSVQDIPMVAENSPRASGFPANSPNRQLQTL